MEGITQTFRALSEEVRLRIVMLLTQGELCVCDLMAIFGEPQSKISRHLAYLKHSGLVQSKRVGVWMHYSLKESLDEISQAQIDFMKAQLAHSKLFEEDVKKMEEVLKLKLCEKTKPGGR